MHSPHLRMLSIIIIFFAAPTYGSFESEGTQQQENCLTEDAPQYLDDNGNYFPWYTKPFLDVLKTWDIHNWEVFEWGAGKSTLWYARHCKSVTSVEHETVWYETLQDEIEKYRLDNVTLRLREPEKCLALIPLPDSTDFVLGFTPDLCYDGKNSQYVLAIEEDDKKYDCIIIDGVHRNTCARHILSHIKPGGIIIVDNADQTSIGISSKYIFKLLNKYEHYSYLQPDSIYPDWRTDYWIIT